VWHRSTSTHLAIKSQRMCCHTVETVRPYIHTQQSGNCNDYIEMYELFNPETPGLEPPNPGTSGLRNISGIPGFGIPGLESLPSTIDAPRRGLIVKHMIVPATHVGLQAGYPSFWGLTHDRAISLDRHDSTPYNIDYIENFARPCRDCRSMLACAWFQIRKVFCYRLLVGGNHLTVEVRPVIEMYASHDTVIGGFMGSCMPT
jgi:hypothetical protein